MKKGLIKRTGKNRSARYRVTEAGEAEITEDAGRSSGRSADGSSASIEKPTTSPSEERKTDGSDG